MGKKNLLTGIGEIIDIPERIVEKGLEGIEGFVQNVKDYYVWEKIFINAGHFVAAYEHDGTEENSIREVTFSEENMKVLAKEMLGADPFRFEEILKDNVLSVLKNGCMEKNNQERCLTQFVQIVIGDIKKFKPHLLECSLSTETRNNTLLILDNQKMQSVRDKQMMDVLWDIKDKVEHRGQDYQQGSNRRDVFRNKTAEKIAESDWHLASLWNGGITDDPHKQQEIALEAIGLWRKEREAYPGWYIAPYQIYKKIWSKTREYEYLIRPGLLPLERELELCYEYVWRCEVGKLTYSMQLQQSVYEIWNQYLSNIGEGDACNIDQWFYIGTVLLREYREDGRYQEWKRIFDCLRIYQNKVLCGKEILDVEEIKCAFFQFQMNRVRRLCGKCHLPEGAHFLRLQVIGLEAECGNTEEALKHLRELKTDLEKIIEVLDDAHEELQCNSLYAVLFRVESLLQQGVAFKEGEYEKYQEQINVILNQAEDRKDYFNWEEQISYVESSLLEWYGKKYEEKRPFELGKETITLMSFANICEESYYLYRLVDAMAIPLVSDCVNLLGRIEKPWLEALQEMMPRLALFLILRGSKSDTVKSCYNRQKMMLMKSDEVVFQIVYLKDALLENLEEMAELTSIYGGGVCRELQGNLPEILIRCMSRCPEEMQCEILSMLRTVMEMPDLTLDHKMAYFVWNILRQISEKNKVKMLGQMLETKIVEHEEIHGESTDLFDFYFRKENLKQYSDLCKIQPEVIENLLSDNKDSIYVWRTKIARLMVIRNIGGLKPEHELSLTDKIWSRLNKNQLPDLPNYYLWNYMKLPYGDRLVPVISIKDCFLKNGMMSLYGKEEGCQVTMGSIRYLDELLTASSQLEKDFWNVDEVEFIYKDAISYWNILRCKMENSISPLRVDEYRIRANKMFHMMAEVYKNISGEISENIQNQIQQVLVEARRIELNTCDLGVLFISKEKREEFVEELIERFYSDEQHTANDALVAAYTFIEKYPKEKLSQRLLKEMLYMLRSGKKPGLVSVINILHNLLYENNPAFSEDKMQEADHYLMMLEKKTRYEKNMENEKQVKAAALIRRSCVGLAYQISLRENTVGYPGVLHWKEVCGKEEFADVRNEMLT